MSCLAADNHRILVTSKVLLDGHIWVKLFTQLVEVKNLQVGAEPYASLLWRQLANDEFQQGRFANSVRAYDANLVAP